MHFFNQFSGICWWKLFVYNEISLMPLPHYLLQFHNQVCWAFFPAALPGSEPDFWPPHPSEVRRTQTALIMTMSTWALCWQLYNTVIAITVLILSRFVLYGLNVQIADFHFIDWAVSLHHQRWSIKTTHCNINPLTLRSNVFVEMFLWKHLLVSHSCVFLIHIYVT